MEPVARCGQARPFNFSVQISTDLSFHVLDPGAEVDTAKPAVDGQKLLEARRN